MAQKLIDHTLPSGMVVKLYQPGPIRKRMIVEGYSSGEESSNNLGKLSSFALRSVAICVAEPKMSEELDAPDGFMSIEDLSSEDYNYLTTTIMEMITEEKEPADSPLATTTA